MRKQGFELISEENNGRHFRLEILSDSGLPWWSLPAVLTNVSCEGSVIIATISTSPIQPIVAFDRMIHFNEVRLSQKTGMCRIEGVEYGSNTEGDHSVERVSFELERIAYLESQPIKGRVVHWTDIRTIVILLQAAAEIGRNSCK